MRTLNKIATLRSERLLLRPWRDSDLPPFAALNGDAETMRHFPSVLTTEQSHTLARSLRDSLSEKGWGRWAVEIPGSAPFIGFVGLGRPNFDAPFGFAIEIAWRLARSHWNRGYATEAASRVLEFAFDELGLEEVCSWTATPNLASQRVMEKLGMVRDPERDFEHPKLPVGHRLRPHVFYCVRRERTTEDVLTA